MVLDVQMFLFIYFLIGRSDSVNLFVTISQKPFFTHVQRFELRRGLVLGGATARGQQLPHDGGGAVSAAGAAAAATGAADRGDGCCHQE